MADEWNELRGKLEGLEERPTEALAYVREHAQAGDPNSVLATLDDFAVNHGFLINVGPVKGKILEAEVAAAGAEARILELGCYCAYSAILMAKGLEGSGHLTSIESSEISTSAATGILEVAGLTHRVDVVHGTSSDVIPTLEGSFDFVFLDHWKDLYEPDLRAIESAGLLHEGSVVFADNVGPLFGADQYLGYVRSCGHYENRSLQSTVEYTELEDAVEISTYRGA
ncbi:class I SAM-dependent methyltransferase [Myxococcota bacterium]|nr:class I SAM-dependent methyltransferase [Myxococcota bacterium]